MDLLINRHSKDAQALRLRLAPNLERVGDCIEWTGNLKPRSGYGYLYFGGSNRPVHRLVYELQIGQIPDGLFVMHLCDNRPCCNPAHLAVGTPSDNMVDCASKGRNAMQRKTHCPRGHEYTPENTHIRQRVQRGRPNRSRVCRTCRKMHAENSQAKRRKEAG